MPAVEGRETGRVYTSREAAELGGEILEVDEKPGIFRRALPVLPIPIAVILAVLNIVPGLGTTFAAFFSLCFPHALENKCKGFFINIAAAILQVITSPIMVGWIWSVIWGMTMVQLARKLKRLKREYTYLTAEEALEHVLKRSEPPKVPKNKRKSMVRRKVDKVVKKTVF